MTRCYPVKIVLPTRSALIGYFAEKFPTNYYFANFVLSKYVRYLVYRATRFFVQIPILSKKELRAVYNTCCMPTYETNVLFNDSEFQYLLTYCDRFNIPHNDLPCVVSSIVSFFLGVKND